MGDSAEEFDVLLYHNCIPVLCCKGRDLNPGETFLVEASMSFPVNAQLEVEFIRGPRHGLRRGRLSARVSSCSDEGLSLVFIRPGGQGSRAAQSGSAVGARPQAPRAADDSAPEKVSIA